MGFRLFEEFAPNVDSRALPQVVEVIVEPARGDRATAVAQGGQELPVRRQTQADSSAVVASQRTECISMRRMRPLYSSLSQPSSNIREAN